MNNPHLPFECTTAELEKAAIQRFRTLVNLLPSQCQVFREPWDCSTVVCLDFVQCPHLLDSIREQEQLLIEGVKELGLGNAIVFRLGKKLMGWKVFFL
ncbi:hypothetical protein VB715_02575 [Crocosphaera sp. UHCC 0190]|uniref:hypothetical protein n=1 Tax=Crocosphaera sp. UHCC 0190 TaxID=3110246 RepID=UPI002B1F8A9C|nr:hypothetical protein [Crocosphaera sp. UHCC 0190]MEA5508640.1 hypothetical protein [Crocosphaera sp. UHCC 0190]